MKKMKKLISLFLASALTVNIIVPAGIPVSGFSLKEYNDMLNKLLTGTNNYIDSRINDDGSIKDSDSISDALDIMSSGYLLEINENEKFIALNERLGQLEVKNTEEKAALAAALKNPDYLESVLENQKENNGFGNDTEDSSSMKATLAFLNAANECSAYYDYAEYACDYIISHETKDGTYAYELTSEPDDLLTSQVVYELSRFAKNDISDEKKAKFNEANAVSIDHIRKNTSDLYDDSNIEQTLYDLLAMDAYDEQIDVGHVLEALSDSQKSDGSFAESIHVTSLAIRLIEGIQHGNHAVITGIKASIDKTAIVTNELNIINASIDLSYMSSCDKELTLKAVAMNGDKKIFDDSKTIILKKPDESDIQNSSDGEIWFNTNAVFKLNENVDNGIKLFAEVYDRDLLLGRSVVFEIKLTSRDLAKNSQIDKFYLELDKYSTLSGVPCDVSAKGNLLYTSNTDIKADIKATVSKDEKIISEKTVTVDLNTENTFVSADLFDYSFDSKASGEYIFKAECIYNGKSILSDSKSFFVTDSKLDPENEKHFNVLWLNPVLNNEYAYAGQSTDISVRTDMIYESDEAFDGQLYITAQNVKDKTVIAEKTADISLEPVNTDALPEDGKMPEYKSEELLSLTPDTTGQIIITAELKDSEGNTVTSSSKNLTVITKAFSDLILYSEKDESGSAVNLRWNDISTEKERYNYQLTRRKKGEIWESRSIWNETDPIKVLNVYPAEPYLKEWMESPLEGSELTAGMGIFDIDSVHIGEFNDAPSDFMYDSKGNFKYDVIFFGSSDCNSNHDLSDEAYTETQKFVDEGRGVLFGHDTLCENFGHTNFCKFEEQLGILVINDTSLNPSESVTVLKFGTLTNYPWIIRGTLEVPNCHSYGQYVGGTLAAEEWMTLNATKLTHSDTHSHSNFYLVSNNNLAMIQTGHSNGSATDDERKVLANTLFYLYQSARRTTAKDTTFYDIDAPDIPSADTETDGKSTFTINASSKDNSTTYEYSIIATPSFSDDKIPASNITEHETLSGLAGFVAKFSDSDKPDMTLIKYDENGEKVQDIIAADENGNALITMQRDEKKDGRYIHLFAVDKANNVSSEIIIDTKNAGLKGDVNDDGVFNVLDIVQLKKWILAVPDTKLSNSKNADLDKNGKINIIDYSMMLRLLINNNA